jgi:hypothetical protein
MGWKVPLILRSSRLGAAGVLAFVLLSLVAALLVRNNALAATDPNASLETPPSASVDLAECARPNVVLVPAPGISPHVSSTAAQVDARGIGAEGLPSSSFLAQVTIGLNPDSAPTSSTTRQDVNGVTVAARPAWVFVYRNQHIISPGGRIPARRGATARPARANYVTTLAAIVDANTGRLIYGWGC